MAHKSFFIPCLLAALLVFLAILCTSASSQAKHAHVSSHILIRRSHSPNPHQGTRRGTEEGGGERSPHSEDKEQEEEETVREALHEAGFTRVIYDEEGIIPDDGDDYYYDFDNDDSYLHPQKELEKLEKEGKFDHSFPKKYHEMNENAKSPPTDKSPKHHYGNGEQWHPGGVTDSFPNWAERETEKELPDVTSVPSTTSSSEEVLEKERVKKKDPIVLPVTTEGKTGSKQKTEDPLKVYGFPKELLPIMPGGGSRFDDVEREKLEKKKMSQTKGSDDDSAENGGSHEAESLYSSASLSSLSLCFYWLMSFHRLDRILLL